MVVADASELLNHLRERLTYDAAAGAFYRKAGFTGVTPGERLGSPGSQKRQAVFLGKRYQTDHLVWLWETGDLPTGTLTHLNGDDLDDRFSNLKLGRRALSVDEGRQAAAFLAKAESRFGTRFVVVSFERQGGIAQATLICPDHGEFSRDAAGFLVSKYGCPRCRSEQCQAARRTTPEQKLERQLAYQRAHRDVYRGSTQRMRERIKKTEPERWAAILQEQNIRAKAWAKTDKGRTKGRLDRQNRRARLKALPSVGVTAEQWEAICDAHRSDAGDVCCKYCKKPCRPTMEHVVPIARGGRHEPSNVVPACRSCNSSKCDQLVSEWPRAALLLASEELLVLVTLTEEHLGAG